MRDPRMTDANIDSEPHVIKFEEDPGYFEIQEYDLNVLKEFNKFIQKVKQRVRTSFEYKEFISYLKNTVKMNQCSVYENISNEDSFRIRIELHHHPFTLEDIVTTVYNKKMSLGEPVDIETVAKEVMLIHYKMLVGLIPLSKTPHEVLHGNYFFIPISKVFGLVEDYYNEYKDYMPPEQIELYENNKEASESFDSEEYKKLFEINHIKYEGLPTHSLEDVLDMIKEYKESNKKL